MTDIEKYSEVLFEKIKVEQMTDLDQYIIPEFE